MKFLTNTYDPSHPFAPGMVTIGRGETQAEAWARQQRWLEGKIISDPQATQSYSVQELKTRNMVGVYAPEAPQ